MSKLRVPEVVLRAQVLATGLELMFPGPSENKRETVANLIRTLAHTMGVRLASADCVATKQDQWRVTIFGDEEPWRQTGGVDALLRVTPRRSGIERATNAVVIIAPSKRVVPTSDFVNRPLA